MKCQHNDLNSIIFEGECTSKAYFPSEEGSDPMLRLEIISTHLLHGDTVMTVWARGYTAKSTEERMEAKPYGSIRAVGRVAVMYGETTIYVEHIEVHNES